MIAFERNLVDLVAAEDLRKLDDLRGEQNEIGEIGFDPGDLRRAPIRAARFGTPNGRRATQSAAIEKRVPGSGKLV